MISHTYQYIAVGRRKTSIARVTLKSGNGEIIINDKPLENYFSLETLRNEVMQPFLVTETQGQYHASIKVSGGGPSGQAGAIKVGIARALVRIKDELRSILRTHGLLTRDPRMVERKKYGQRKARKRFQFSKR